ncbi:Cell division cycle-associated 7-like protein, partial [Cucurbita argyrosperma subsp. sororia]
MEIDRPSAVQMPEVSQYEQSRELRIRENLERMQKLGIFDLSLKLKSSAPSRQNRRRSLNPKASPPSFNLPQEVPVRRSSRLQNVTPVTYSELRVERKSKFSEDEGVILEDGSRPEIYSEEHEKRLGSTEKIWTLFVDGYGKDGKRIYDPVKGKTCHQCRQKTLGHRTHCSKCNMVQGQFCGDCLYMRYGEHVLEAQENPSWICPVCRGICNCSLCRQAKGWLPTGSLYKKIARMGFKSVAHFLIQTKRPQPNSGQNPTDLASAKRALSFPDFEANPVGSLSVNDQMSVKRSLSFSCLEQQGSKECKPHHLDHENDEQSQLQSANYDELGEDVVNEKEQSVHCLKRKNDGDNYSPMPVKKPTIRVESSTVDQSLEKKTDDIRCLTSSRVIQESDDKTSEEGANSLSKKKLKCASNGRVLRPRHQSLEKTTDISSQTTILEGGTSSSELKSATSSRVLRPRHKTMM